MIYKAHSLPQPSCRADLFTLAYPSAGEAEQVKYGIEVTDEHGGMIIVEYQGLFYVVYNEDPISGFSDYEKVGY